MLIKMGSIPKFVFQNQSVVNERVFFFQLERIERQLESQMLSCYIEQTLPLGEEQVCSLIRLSLNSYQLIFFKKKRCIRILQVPIRVRIRQRKFR